MNEARLSSSSSGSGWVEPPRQRVITVVVLGGDFSGALAYALQRGLEEPAAVRAVRLEPAAHPARVKPPIPVGDLIGEPARALAQVSSHSDLMVVQGTEDPSDRVIDGLLARLGRDTRCPLVEVDQRGDIVEVAGPDGWSYVAPRELALVGTDQASRVPPPLA